MESANHQLCSEGHALAIARWEDNHEHWLEGNYLGLVSKKPYLQEIVGEGGTLWIIVSRPGFEKRRLYSLSFRLNNCRLKTYPKAGTFGKYAVMGDPSQSTLFASNNANRNRHQTLPILSHSRRKDYNRGQ